MTLPMRVPLDERDYADLVAIGETLEGKGAPDGAGARLAARIIHDALEAHRRGKGPQRAARRLSDADLGRIAERAKAGATPEALAAVFGVTPETIRKHLRKLTGSARTVARV